MMTRERFEELWSMDSDEMYDTIPLEEMEPYSERLASEVARLRQEAADRAEVHRRHIAEERQRIVGLDLDNQAALDDIRHAKAKSKELLIDYGVEAAKRGEDPIEAMRERRKEVAFCVELVRQGYITVDIQNGAAVATHRTVKGRNLMARIRAQK